MADTTAELTAATAAMIAAHNVTLSVTTGLFLSPLTDMGKLPCGN